MVDDVSILDKVIVKTKKLNLKEDPSRKDNLTPADNSLVATYKFLCRVGHVFALKSILVAVVSYFYLLYSTFRSG